MKAVIQRVKSASVTIEGKVYSQIKEGCLVLLGIDKADKTENADKIAEKLVNLRIFEDDKGKMSKSVKDIDGELLVVSQFTICADLKKGNRPSFDNAMQPDEAEKLYEYTVEQIKKFDVPVETGVFGAHMEVKLLNNGPVTFVLER
ncbi:D-tyrosyl-tRNA(Tyr) deacylase [bacterium]|nr:D-tyrosyl-tRNA(Tyr) deacylase [bacterium]